MDLVVSDDRDTNGERFVVSVKNGKMLVKSKLIYNHYTADLTNLGSLLGATVIDDCDDYGNKVTNLVVKMSIVTR